MLRTESTLPAHSVSHRVTPSSRVNIRPDVVFWGNTNPRAGLTLKRIATACLSLGLRTTVLWWQIAGRSSLTPDFYDVPGLESFEFKTRRNYGPFRYPRPIVLPLLASAAMRTLRELSPRSIFTQLDHTQVDRVWQYAAHRQSIPGFVIQEGMANVPKAFESLSPRQRRRWTLGNFDRFDRLSLQVPHPLLRPVAPYMYAQYACVWGQAMKRHLIRMGREKNTVFVTGSPAFDDVVDGNSMSAAEGDYVLYAQQRMGMPLEKRLPHYRHLIKTVTKEIGCRLIFKLHPNCYSESSCIQQLAEQLGTPPNLIEIVDQGDAVDLLSQARALLVATSTTAYHAIVAQIPLVVLDYYSEDVRFDVGSSAGATVVASSDMLESKLRKTLFDTEHRKSLSEGRSGLLREHLHQLDGHASLRIANAIASSIGSREPDDEQRR